MKQDLEATYHKNQPRSLKFRRQLLEWDRRENKRAMPWKGEKDPYKVWLSEIILQQTRVEQGLKYYEKFVKTYPTIDDLSEADEQEVFRLWEGLGYYSRCRNLIATARYISQENAGRFPSTHSEILALKGIGAYTAAAISSFAFGQPHAVLDGNVFRVISRIHAIDTPSDTTEGKKLFTGLANQMLSQEEPGRYNQAIMDFGATICKPLPQCHACFFRKGCKAYLEEKQLLYPVRMKTLNRKERWLNYIVISNGDKYAIRKRQAADIWKDLFEFLLLETPAEVSDQVLLGYVLENVGRPRVTGKPLGWDQQLTHQRIHFRFLQVIVDDTTLTDEFQWVSKAELSGFAFPKSLRQYISSELL
jgi:A/G-specific adenine glycosylase